MEFLLRFFARKSHGKISFCRFTVCGLILLCIPIRINAAIIPNTDIASTSYVQGAIASIASALSQKADSSDLANYVPISSMGEADGVATLDGDGLVPLDQLPAGIGGGAQADWSANSGPSEILNKPTLGSAAAADTSDFAAASALSNYIPTSQRGAVNGVASLDANTTVPVTQLPVGTTTNTVAAGDDSRFALAASAVQPAALATTLANYILTSQRGAVNGVASLDANTTVPVAQLPVGTTSNTVAAGNDGRFDSISNTKPSGSPAAGRSFIWVVP